MGSCRWEETRESTAVVQAGVGVHLDWSGVMGVGRSGQVFRGLGGTEMDLQMIGYGGWGRQRHQGRALLVCRLSGWQCHPCDMEEGGAQCYAINIKITI